MKLYLSGPMTGYPEWNYPAFAEAASLLRATGHEVLSPAENFEGDTTRSYAEYMRKDIEQLLTVEGVAVLPGWEASRGASIEVSIAKALDLPVVPVADLVPQGVGVRVESPMDQPAPVPNEGTPVWDLVITDMRERDRVGRQRYGTPLQTHNGRDALVDAYQEGLDLVVYLRQAIEERAA